MTREEHVKNIVETIPRDKNTLINASPRFGKTACVIEIIKKWEPRNILWVTPSRKLADEDIPNEFKKWEASIFLPKLKTTTYSSLHKLIGDVDLLVLDEVQSVTMNNCVKLLSKKLNPTTIIGITGTPSKDKEKQSIYQSLGLVERYNISIKEAQKSNIISDYKVNVLYEELSEEKDLLTKGGKFKTSEIKMYEWYSSKIEEALMTNNYKSQKFFSLQRMKFLANCKTKKDVVNHIIATEYKKRMIVFCPSIEFAESICKYTYHSKTSKKNLIDFEKGDINIIAMVNSGSVGFTYKGIEKIIIIQADSNKNGSTIQKIARSFLNDGIIPEIDIICIKNTVDEKWVNKSLEDIDKSKVSYYNFKTKQWK